MSFFKAFVMAINIHAVYVYLMCYQVPNMPLYSIILIWMSIQNNYIHKLY